MGRLAEDYEYQAGDVLIIAVQQDMDVEAVLAPAACVPVCLSAIPDLQLVWV